MKKIVLFISGAILLFAFFLSCNNGSKKNAERNENKKVENTEDAIKSIVIAWNDAHNNKDFDEFIELYNENVEFYKASLDGTECAQKKENLLEKYSDFQQSIGKIDFEKIKDDEYKCSFNKTVKVNGDTHEYPSYLVVVKTESGWKISEESDLITDENIAKMNSPEYAIPGDFNSDGALEYMWLEQPEFPKNEESFGECVGDCNCVIKFSDKNIPPIEIEMCIGGYPVNEGDLDGDGTYEIGILPYWWTSYWKAYYVYTLKNGKWEYLVDPIDTHFSQWKKGTDVICKTKGKPGYVTISYTDYQDFEIKTKDIKLN
ncbi:MAG: hypothetical protein C0596_15630 [Marinilabiliales bacterium]|nr:MAG: hypothetical protein C0596_15630 [Marinilabiliales bacterium]